MIKVRCDECLQKIKENKLYFIEYKDKSKVLIIPCKCGARNKIPSSIIRTQKAVV